LYTPKAFANYSPGQRPGIEIAQEERTLKEFAFGNEMILGNPFRVAWIQRVESQGSALTRATLGLNLRTPSAFARASR